MPSTPLPRPNLPRSSWVDSRPAAENVDSRGRPIVGPRPWLLVKFVADGQARVLRRYVSQEAARKAVKLYERAHGRLYVFFNEVKVPDATKPATPSRAGPEPP